MKTLMFESIRLYISQLGGKRIEILSKRFTENGGIIVNDVTKANLILSEKTDFTYLPVVGPDWISESIIIGKMLDIPPIGDFSAKKLDMNDSETESDLESSVPKKKQRIANEFKCMEPSKILDHEMNSLLIRELECLHKRYIAEGDKWRILSYKRAIQALKDSLSPIRSGEDAKKLRGVGSKIADKIQEIIDTGFLEKNNCEPEYVQVVTKFMGIYGVGSKIAQQWYQQGMRTLEDIRKRKDITHGQKIGLKYFEDFQLRIPREEVSNFEKSVQKVCMSIDTDIESMVLGSYRRGAPSCGDIDVLVYNKSKFGIDKQLMKMVVAALKEKGLIVDIISVSEDTFRGVCCFGGPKRRLDILICPRHEVGAAMLYFTGNDMFNRSIRLLAGKKGYHLNQRGLFVETTKSIIGKRVAGEDEKSIFDALDVPYRAPEERNA